MIERGKNENTRQLSIFDLPEMGNHTQNSDQSVIEEIYISLNALLLALEEIIQRQRKE